MADVIDLMSVAKVDPSAFKAVVADSRKAAEFGLTSAQLDMLKKLDPKEIGVLVEAIEARLRTGPVAGTNACPGTFACFGGKAAEAMSKVR
jgi:hypothetical protein